MVAGVPACFIYCDQVDKDISGYRLCLAVQTVTGDGNLDGIQKFKGLYRIYAKSTEAREALLQRGITLNRIHIPVMDSNPKIVDPSVKTVKLIIGQIPLSVSNLEIDRALRDMDGVSIRSKLFDENYRDDTGGLTSFKTGRRYIYIEAPARPLPKFVQIMKWRASLYHYGQKSDRITPVSPHQSQGYTDSHRDIPGSSSSESIPSTTRSVPDSPAGETRNTNQKTMLSFFRKPAAAAQKKAPAMVHLQHSARSPSPTHTHIPTPILSPTPAIQSTRANTSTAHRGRPRTRQPFQSRSRSMSMRRRKRSLSDETESQRSQSKSKKSTNQVKEIDYFDYENPTE